MKNEKRKRQKPEKIAKRRKKGTKTHLAKQMNEETLSKASMEITEFATLELSSVSVESDDVNGKLMGGGGGLWVCCDGCDQWFNIECTNIRKTKSTCVYKHLLL